MVETIEAEVINTEIKKRGGPRPGSGRPRRMQEEEIIKKLEPMADAAFELLRRKLEEGDIKALQIFCSYYLGLPTQKVESKIEGQLNQVQIEVIKPSAQVMEAATN